MKGSYLEEIEQAKAMHIVNTCCNCTIEAICDVTKETTSQEERERLAKVCRYYKREK